MRDAGSQHAVDPVYHAALVGRMETPAKRCGPQLELQVAYARIVDQISKVLVHTDIEVQDVHK